MGKKQQEFIESMKRYRDIDFARLGMMVEVGGEPGTIMGINSAANLDVVFANRIKMGRHKHNCHPFHDICYYDDKGKVIKDFREPKKRDN